MFIEIVETQKPMRTCNSWPPPKRIPFPAWIFTSRIVSITVQASPPRYSAIGKMTTRCDLEYTIQQRYILNKNECPGNSTEGIEIHQYAVCNHCLDVYAEGLRAVRESVLIEKWEGDTFNMLSQSWPSCSASPEPTIS